MVRHSYFVLNKNSCSCPAHPNEQEHTCMRPHPALGGLSGCVWNRVWGQNRSDRQKSFLFCQVQFALVWCFQCRKTPKTRILAADSCSSLVDAFFNFSIGDALAWKVWSIGDISSALESRKFCQHTNFKFFSQRIAAGGKHTSGKSLKPHHASCPKKAEKWNLTKPQLICALIFPLRHQKERSWCLLIHASCCGKPPYQHSYSVHLAKATCILPSNLKYFSFSARCVRCRESVLNLIPLERSVCHPREPWSNWQRDAFVNWTDLKI